MSPALSVTGQNASDEHFESVLGRPVTADERERLLHNREHMTIRPTNAAILPGLLAPIADVADLLLVRTWTLVVFQTPCLFTGEHPVVHINPRGESHGYGVMTAERLYMPVSTTTALVLSHPWAGWPESVVRGTEELARRLNWAMLTHPSNGELLLHPGGHEDGHLLALDIAERKRAGAQRLEPAGGGSLDVFGEHLLCPEVAVAIGIDERCSAGARALSPDRGRPRTSPYPAGARTPSGRAGGRCGACMARTSATQSRTPSGRGPDH